MQFRLPLWGLMDRNRILVTVYGSTIKQMIPFINRTLEWWQMLVSIIQVFLIPTVSWYSICCQIYDFIHKKNDIFFMILLFPYESTDTLLSKASSMLLQITKMYMEFDLIQFRFDFIPWRNILYHSTKILSNKKTR
jgi:hypothetical protein